MVENFGEFELEKFNQDSIKSYNQSWLPPKIWWELKFYQMWLFLKVYLFILKMIMFYKLSLIFWNRNSKNVTEIFVKLGPVSF